jgi:short-subunit dehydrogenase
MLRRQKGGIINVASLAAFFPLFGNTVYCANKSALFAFSRALDIELDGSGVQVQVLCPGFFHSEFHKSPEYKGVDRSSSRNLCLGMEPIVAESSRPCAGQVYASRGLGKFYRYLGGIHFS